MNIHTNIAAPKIAEITTEEHNDIFMNGYAYGKNEGAEMLIKHLQATINEGNMSDAHEIKMLIYNTWKSICIARTSFNVQEYERTSEKTAEDIETQRRRDKINQGYEAATQKYRE